MRARSPEVTDQSVARHSLQPGQRVVGKPVTGPRIQGANPCFLNEIFGKTAVTAHPPRYKGVKRPDRRPIHLDQLFFTLLCGHISIDAQNDENR